MVPSSKQGNLKHLSCNISLTDDAHPCQVFNLVLCSDLSISLLISSKLHVAQMQNTSYNAQQILGQKQQADIRMMAYKQTQNDARKGSEMFADVITLHKHILCFASGFLQEIHSLQRPPLVRNWAEKVSGGDISWANKWVLPPPRCHWSLWWTRLFARSSNRFYHLWNWPLHSDPKNVQFDMVSTSLPWRHDSC